MADQKISQLATIVTVDNASDLFPIVDTSAAETKKITPSALKTALALNNVDNTSDANKPVSSATQSALNAKQDTLVSGTNIKTVNGTSVLGSGNIAISSAVAWGGVTGTLSDQTDLQTALDGKVDENSAITGATKTKVTYDAKGLVTAGADATTADIADSTDKRYVTDAQLVVVGNTSGTNTGDNATNSQYSGLATSKQDALVSGTNIKTINGTSVLGSGDIVTPSTPPSGAAGAIQFTDGSAFASDAAKLFWDDTNNRLGVGTNTPIATTHIKGSGTTSATTSLLVQNSAGVASLQVLDDTSVFNNGKGAVASNTAFGGGALTSNTTGANNTAIGAEALLSSTTGGLNTAFGVEALRSNTTGANNTANGASALRSNTTGGSNTANGYLALQNNTTGSNNTAIGRQALQSNTASNNTAVGYEAALTNTTGGGITAIGYQALRLSTGPNNTAVGFQSLDANTTGGSNTALGTSALGANTTGSSNTANGASALQSNTASNNTAVGYEAAYTNTTGTGITAIGYQALRLSTGSNNTALGFQAGDNITTGAGNVCIGSGAEPLSATASNQFVVGSSTVNAGSVTTESNLSLRVWNVIINGVAQKILLA
jgi:hypothetical protein